MATKSIDKKKTLEYAVAFYFYDSGCVNFMMGNIMYQHIKTIYDERADGRGQNTLEVVYNYKKMNLGLDVRLNEDLNKLIAAKAQVTKVQRKIDEYVAYNKVHNLFFDENTDADLLKAREKLATKIANVQEAEERLKIKIEKLQKGNNYVGSKK